MILATFLLANSLFAGILKDMTVDLKEVTPSVAESVVEPVKYSYDYSALNENEQKINESILKIKQSDLDSADKIIQIGTILAESGDIKYQMGENLFNGNNQLVDEFFETPGMYYHDGMIYDCSGFMQYLFWVATVEDTDETRSDRFLIERNTYFQTEEGESVLKDDIIPGTLCYRYNGGAGVIRNNNKEITTNDTNHVALYLGDGKYLDCSSSFGGVRIVDVTENDFPETFYTYFVNHIPKDDETYISTLEQEFNRNYWENNK